MCGVRGIRLGSGVLQGGVQPMTQPATADDITGWGTGILAAIGLVGVVISWVNSRGNKMTQDAVAAANVGQKIDHLTSMTAGLRDEFKAHVLEDTRSFAEVKDRLTELTANQKNDRNWLRSVDEELKRKRGRE